MEALDQETCRNVTVAIWLKDKSPAEPSAQSVLSLDRHLLISWLNLQQQSTFKA